MYLKNYNEIGTFYYVHIHLPIIKLLCLSTTHLNTYYGLKYLNL